MTPSLNIRVYGVAKPQGSKLPRVSKSGKPYVQEQAGQPLVDWRNAVTEAAVAARTLSAHQTWDAPIELAIQFLMPRPASVSITKRPFPAVVPDIDKITRGVMDALTHAGVWRDDCLVINLAVTKRYATDDPDGSPGARIRVTLVSTPEII